MSREEHSFLRQTILDVCGMDVGESIKVSIRAFLALFGPGEDREWLTSILAFHEVRVLRGTWDLMNEFLTEVMRSPTVLDQVKAKYIETLGERFVIHFHESSNDTWKRIYYNTRLWHMTHVGALPLSVSDMKPAEDVFRQIVVIMTERRWGMDSFSSSTIDNDVHGFYSHLFYPWSKTVPSNEKMRAMTQIGHMYLKELEPDLRRQIYDDEAEKHILTHKILDAFVSRATLSPAFVALLTPDQVYRYDHALFS
jgi:hypothetical protein